MKKIILATASPYRQEAFRMIGLQFEAEASNIDEQFDGRPEDPKKLVTHLAKMKAESVAKNHDSGIVIGFDSIGWFEGKVLEKPNARNEAVDRMKMLSGKTHEFYTGIHIIDKKSGKTVSDSVITQVKMRNISEDEINFYLNQDPNYKTYAIGFDPLGHFSSTFPISLAGSYNNYLRGIPLEKIVVMLKKLDITF